jgi:hypothetical protein
MSNSENSGSGDSSLPQIREIIERVLTIEEAVQQLKDDLPRIGGDFTFALPPVIHIVNDTSAPPGKVMIDLNDQTKEIFLSSTSKVTFQNDSDVDAKLKFPIGPFKTLHIEKIKPGKKVHFNLNKKLETTDSATSFTFDYSVDPSGNGGGPNIIVRP